jgi:hypothetical protein
LLSFDRPSLISWTDCFLFHLFKSLFVVSKSIQPKRLQEQDVRLFLLEDSLRNFCRGNFGGMQRAVAVAAQPLMVRFYRADVLPLVSVMSG